MRIIKLNEKNKKGYVLSLGFFDSLHGGHRYLINQAKMKAESLNLGLAVFTFSNNPYNMFVKNKSLNQVFTFDERLDIMRELDVDSVFAMELNEQTVNMGAIAFLDKIFHSDVKQVYCGKDYTFGKKKLGDVDMLDKYSKENGIITNIVDFSNCIYHENKQKISTTLIRQLLEDGEIEFANNLLNQNYSLQGTVIDGKKVGRKIGFPTANIKYPEDKVVLKNGVYGTKIVFGNKDYFGITNVGHRPTFEDCKMSVETNIFDFNGDLYGKTLKIEFIKFIRDIKKFDSGESLKKQLKEDIKWME